MTILHYQLSKKNTSTSSRRCRLRVLMVCSFSFADIHQIFCVLASRGDTYLRNTSFGGHQQIRGGGDSFITPSSGNSNGDLSSSPTHEVIWDRRHRLERKNVDRGLADLPSASLAEEKHEQNLPHSEYYGDKDKGDNQINQHSGSSQKKDNTPVASSRIAFESLLDYEDIDSDKYDPLKMYQTCLIIVFIWVFTGTTFYSFVNDWPFPQSFFYAIDAGMSIGFCTDVYETKLISKAFTVIYILLGASCVGGALALFIQDAVEGLVNAHRVEYLRLLEQEEYELMMAEKRGECLHDKSSTTAANQLSLHSSSSPLQLKTSATQQFLESKKTLMNNFFSRSIEHCLTHLKCAWQSNHRIYIVFVLWVALGIGWGIVDQKWDVITASHFAISALATGGLTAPPVNELGILPAEPAIFCGTYCLFGIPLFALTLGHFARVLVQDHVVKAELSAIQRQLTPAEFEFASKKLSTPNDNLMHLSDFVVLQLLRQGKITPEVVTMMRKRFERLDVDGVGTLSLERATSSL